LSIALTALHGVGGADLVEMLQIQDFNDLRIVEEQQLPNPDFPTVNYPNPEELQAMEMVQQLAKQHQSDLVLALDPDADRLGVGCYDKHIKDYRNLTGDEIGIIFTHHFINYHHNYFTNRLNNQISGENSLQKTSEVKSASSFTSTQLVQKMCAKHSIPYVMTNTGAKNVSRVPNLLFGYEESLGYIVLREHIRDKDGLLPAVLMANIARNLKANGHTLIDLLDEIALEYGLYLQKLVTKRFATAEDVQQLNNRLVQQHGFTIQNGNEFNALEYRNGNTRIITRQSGTEPKVKYYIEVEQNCNDGANDIELLRKRGQSRLEEVANYLSD
jgi:phosphomannomutase